MVADTIVDFQMAILAQETAFKTGERVNGTQKDCFYEYMGNEYFRTVKLTQLCPLSIKVNV